MPLIPAVVLRKGDPSDVLSKLQYLRQSVQVADEILLDCQMNYLGPKTKEICYRCYHCYLNVLYGTAESLQPSH